MESDSTRDGCNILQAKLNHAAQIWVPDLVKERNGFVPVCWHLSYFVKDLMVSYDCRGKTRDT